MRTLFEITGDLLALDELLFESGGDITGVEVSQAVDDWFSELDGDLTNKVDNYCSLIKEIELRASNRKHEEDRMRSLRKSDENAVKGLKRRMQEALDALGKKRIDTDLFRVTVAKNGGKQPMELDESAITDDYKKVVYVPDKDAIRSALEGGVELPFAELKERGRSLRIG